MKPPRIPAQPVRSRLHSFRSLSRTACRHGQFVALLAGSSLLAVGTIQANTEDDVLSGLAANSNLSLASSYSTTAPSTGGVPTTTSDVVFTAAGTYTSPYTFGSSLSIGSLNDLSATALTLQNNVGTLTLNGGNSVSGTPEDLLYVATGGSLTIANSNGFSVALGASGNFNVAGTASIAAPITGALALTKTGAGTLTLTNTGNVFSGGTTVSAGTLALGAGNGAGVVRGVVTVNTGATLNLTGNNALGFTAGTQVTTLNINGGTVNTTSAVGDQGFLTSFNLTGGTLAYTGTNAANAYQIAAGDATAPNITSNASATSSLISGNVVIRSGNLPINVAAGTTTTGTDLQISGVISAANAAYAVTKNGTGNLVLSGFNTYNGGTTVNGGTLTLATGGLNGAVLGVVSLAGGTTLNLAAVDALGYNGAAVVVSTINANGATINNTSGGNEGFLTSFNLTGATVSSTAPTTGVNAGKVGVYLFNTVATAPPTITSNASATVSTISAPVFLSGAGSLGVNVARGTTADGTDLLVSGLLNGVGGITKSGVGYLSMTGATSTFTGNIAVNAGTLNIGAIGADNGVSSAVGATNGKTITVASGATLSASVNNVFGRGAANAALPTITLNGGTFSTTRYNVLGALNLNGATITTSAADTGNYQALQFRGNVTVGGTAASTINATNVSATTGGNHLDTTTTFTVNSTGATGPDLTVNAPLRDRSGDYQNTAGGLTKAGAGAMLLTAASTYTGGTIINAGTLLTSGTATLGAGNVAINAGTLTLGSSVSFADTATLTFANGSTITLNNTATDTLANIVYSNNTALVLNPGTYSATDLDLAFGVTSFTGNGFLNITPIPEPSTSTWIGSLVLVGLGMSCRRRITGWLRFVRG